MSPTPAISVVMPAWNAAPFVDAAVESILGQSWRDFEFIIIDDGSTDGTRERIAAWAARDARIRAMPNERNLGLARTLNRGLGLARARWMARMDADDLSRRDRLARQWAAAQRTAGVALVTCPHDVIQADGRIVRWRRGVCCQRGLLPWFLLFYNRLGGGGQVLMATEALRAAGGYDPAAGYSADYDTWLRLVRVAPPVVVDQSLYVWRAANPNSLSWKLPFRYSEPSLELSRAEILRWCGLEVSREQIVAVRDFWARFPDPANDWDGVQRVLAESLRRYRPPYAIPEFAKGAPVAIACGWLRLAVRGVRGWNVPFVRGHLRRARQAAGGRWPAALAQFAAEVIRVGGRLNQLH